MLSIKLQSFTILFMTTLKQFTLPLKLTPLTRPITSCQTFLVRNLYTYYFKQSFKVSLKFFPVIFILFFSQFNDIFRFAKRNIHRDFQSIFTSFVNTFHVCKCVQSATEQAQKHGYYHGGALLQMANHFLFYSENQYKLQQQYFLPLRWLTFSRIANTRQPRQVL